MLNVGGVRASLGATLDASEFRQFDSLLDKSRRDAARPVNAKLGVDGGGRARDELGRYKKGLDDVDDGLDRHDRSTNKAGKSHGKFLGVIGKSGASFRLFATGAAGAGVAVGLLSKTVIGSASDIEESLSKNRVLFGKSARDVEAFAATSAKSYGISRKAALEYTGTFGNLFRALGESEQASAKTSVELTKLAADMASFNNSSPEEALEAIRSGLVGETEPLRRFGVNMNDAELRAEALKQGLVSSTKEALDPHAKALAAVGLVTKQTEKAHGDFERTNDGLANKTKILKARISDVGATMGKALLPVALAVVTGLGKLVGVFEGGGKAGGKFSGVMGKIGDGFRTYLDFAKQFYGYLGRVGGRIFDDNRGSIERFGRAFGSLIKPLGDAGRKIGKVFQDTFGKGSGMGDTWRQLERGIRNVIRIFLTLTSTLLEKVYVPIVKRIIPGIVQVFQGLARIIRGVVKVIAGVLTLDFGKAWEGVKDIFSGAAKVLGGLIRAMTAPFRAAIAALGQGISGAFSKVWGGIVGTAEGFVNKIIDVINLLPFVNIGKVGGGGKKLKGSGRFTAGGENMVAGDGDGRAPRTGDGLGGFIKGAAGGAIGLVKKGAGVIGGLAGGLIGDLPGNPGGPLGGMFDWVIDKAKDFIGDKVKSLFGGGGGGLMGANAALGPFAAIGKAFGLGVSSGARPGSITSSGNISYHSSGEAIDVAGDAGGMMNFFRTLRDNFGGALAELIYTPGGVGIKNGAPHTYTGKVAADHFDHVHVALDLGRAGPGIGDGDGRTGPRMGDGDGKKKKRSKLSRIKSSAKSRAKKIGGIGLFEQQIADLERTYGQQDRAFGMSEENLIIENADGSTSVDVGAQTTRLTELGELRKTREKVYNKIKEYRRRVLLLIKVYRDAITKLKNAIKAAAGKGSAKKKERGRYKAAIADYADRIGELKDTANDLGFDLKDSQLDLDELDNEIAEVGGTRGVAAPVDTSAPDPAASNAAAVLEAVAGFNASRADLFAQYGANFLSPAAIARAGGVSPLEQAAGARFFGGGSGGTDGGAFGAAGGVTQHITFTGPQPLDPHTFAQATLHELSAAV